MPTLDIAEVLNPKVSIVIPIYNVEKFLRKCLDSILAQTLVEWECILVNDYSPDKSIGICEEYARKDSRFVCISHTVNMGPSAARNSGLDIAKGKYIGFVDPDDYIHKKMYEVLFHNAEIHDVEISSCSALYKSESEKVERLFNEELKSGKYERKSLGAFGKMPQHWASIYKRTYVEKENIRFDLELRSAQDILWRYQCYLTMSSLYHENIPFYYYVENFDGITHDRGFGMRDMCAILCQKKCINISPDEKEEFREVLVSRYTSTLFSIESARITNELLELLQRYYPESSVKKVIDGKYKRFLQKALWVDCRSILSQSNIRIMSKLKFICYIILPWQLGRFIYLKGRKN